MQRSIATIAATTCASAMASAASRSSDSNSSVTTDKRMASSSDATCGCATGGVPRTCYACLNELLVSQTPCVLNPVGLCVSAASAESYATYFNATYYARAAPGVIQHGNEFFAAADATYCEPSDSACASCSAQWVKSFERDALRTATSFSCIGSGGCMCTAYCSVRASLSAAALSQEYSVGGETCAAPVSSTPTVQSSAARKIALMRNIMALLLGATVVVLVVRAAVAQFHQQRYERRMRERRRTVRQQRIELGRFGPMLSLEGWSRFRQQLMERERSRGVPKDPIALTDAPTHVTIEGGEGFRPASPSVRAS